MKGLEQLDQFETYLKRVGETLETNELQKLLGFYASFEQIMEGWLHWLTTLKPRENVVGFPKRVAICESHIAFLNDFKKRTMSEGLDVAVNEFFVYRLRALGSPKSMTEPWQIVWLVKMGENELSALRLINKHDGLSPTACIIAPHSDTKSNRYWVHYPSKTLGGGPVRPIHRLGKKARETALFRLVGELSGFKRITDERVETRGMVGTNDGGPIKLVTNPAEPNTVTSLGPCSADEFFEKLGYLSIGEDEGNQGRRVVAIADTKWEERLYPYFRKIFNDPLPVVFTHGNLIPENVLCNDDGSICEITGWERAGWLPQGWEGVAALRNRASTNKAATWHAISRDAVSVVDGSSPLYDMRFCGLGEIFSDWAASMLPKLHPDFDLLQLENIRLRDHPSWYDRFRSPTERCMHRPLHKRRIRKYTEEVGVQGGDEEPSASDA